jgi:hypothetical protein
MFHPFIYLLGQFISTGKLSAFSYQPSAKKIPHSKFNPFSVILSGAKDLVFTHKL